MNKSEQREWDKKQTDERCIKYFVLGFVGCFIVIVIGLFIFRQIVPRKDSPAPYALKHNGDTLFIPTQVVVKHDTLVVIRTEERRPVQDSIEAANWSFTSTGGSLTFVVDTSAMVSPHIQRSYVLDGGYEVWPKKRYSPTRDTIYEHKIIYY